jgi:hypothetical protein
MAGWLAGCCWLVSSHLAKALPARLGGPSRFHIPNFFENITFLGVIFQFAPKLSKFSNLPLAAI